MRANPKAKPIDDSAAPGDSPRFLVISTFHDYRSPRRASLYFIADELARRGRMRFFSARYSNLSKRTGDPRLSLDDQVNRSATHHGVECYLWKTPVHPFSMGAPLAQSLEPLLYGLYRRMVPRVLKDWIVDSDVIFLESGITPIFFELVRSLNPSARTVYVASDDLETIGVARSVQAIFQREAPSLDVIALPSPKLMSGMPAGVKAYGIPHGMDPEMAERADPSPYSGGCNAVSVGSMLFDPDCIAEAARRFPQVHFHVIGCGQPRPDTFGDNVTVYGEMPYDETLRYIKHADLGLAPYWHQEIPAYLADTSMKLMQYDYFGVPAVCPHAVVGDYAIRFGYQPGDSASIETAVRQALDSPGAVPQSLLTWSEVVDRCLDPGSYADIRLPT